mmetsp:Transcript_46030/g.127862  ORF Transcript_46030/g.127862 Transcript_46030/m.127862 type:complete len:131 (-) Transcript_46030:509-901(-)
MIHLVHVFACQESTARCWLGGSGSFAGNIEKFNLFSVFEFVDPGRHLHILGNAVASPDVCACRKGSGGSVLAEFLHLAFVPVSASAMQCRGAWPAVASWDDARTLGSRSRCHQVVLWGPSAHHLSFAVLV